MKLSISESTSTSCIAYWFQGLVSAAVFPDKNLQLYTNGGGREGERGREGGREGGGERERERERERESMNNIMSNSYTYVRR